MDRLLQLWREHEATRFPRGRGGDEVARVDLALLDADIAGCVDSYLRRQELDAQRARILATCLNDANRILGHLRPDEVGYFARLREMAALTLERISSAGAA